MGLLITEDGDILRNFEIKIDVIKLYLTKMNWMLMCKSPIWGHVNVFKDTKAKTLNSGCFTFEQERCTHIKNKVCIQKRLWSQLCAEQKNYNWWWKEKQSYQGEPQKFLRGSRYFYSHRLNFFLNHRDRIALVMDCTDRLCPGSTVKDHALVN